MNAFFGRIRKAKNKKESQPKCNEKPLSTILNIFFHDTQFYIRTCSFTSNRAIVIISVYLWFLLNASVPLHIVCYSVWCYCIIHTHRGEMILAETREKRTIQRYLVHVHVLCVDHSFNIAPFWFYSLHSRTFVISKIRKTHLPCTKKSLGSMPIPWQAYSKSLISSLVFIHIFFICKWVVFFVVDILCGNLSLKCRETKHEKPDTTTSFFPLAIRPKRYTNTSNDRQ